MSSKNLHLDVGGLGEFPTSAGSSAHHNRSKLETERIKKGQCPTCGTTTHKVERTIFGRKQKQPLTIEGQALRGICLVCNGPAADNANANVATATSTATNQITSSHHHNVKVNSAVAGAGHAPVAAVTTANAGATSMSVPNIPTTGATMTNTGGGGIPQVLEVKHRHADDATVVSQITLDHRLIGNGTANDNESDEDTSFFRVRPGERRPEPSLCDDNEDQRPERWRPPHSNTNTNTHPINEQQQQQHLGEPVLTAQVSRVYNNRTGTLPSFAEEKTEIEATSPPSTSGTQEDLECNTHNQYAATSSSSSKQQQQQQQYNPVHSLAEIPDLVAQLHSQPGKAIPLLAEIVSELGQDAKLEIAERNGLAGITQSMWASMGGDPAVQEAALRLLFGLAASRDAQASSDVLVGESADDAVDALLIVMQQFLTVENIQYYGCGVLACLAAASGDADAVNDGSLSGALVSVVSAMEAHRNAKGIQEWGLRCLYNLCVYSRHAESNKRILAKTGMEENRRCGASIIYQAIELCESDVLTMEWACRLYWCLSASEDVAGFLTVTHHPIHVMLEALQRFFNAEGAADLVKCIFGALSNLVKVGENNKVIDPSVLHLIIKATQEHRRNEDLIIEAFALIANLVSLSPDSADVAVDAEAIKVIFKGIKAFPYNAELFEEATRALSCLCITSEDAKGHLSTPTMLSYLSLATTTHKDSMIGQEMMFYLLSSILTQKSFWKTLVAHGGVDMIVTSMKNHPYDRRVQEAACLTMRNLCCGDTDAAPVDFSEPINLIISAMANHPSSPSIQLHGCCALWNLAFVKNQFRYEVSDNDMIQHIVKAMQNHMESGAVLEMACGALCSKISGSQERKQSLVESGGLDAVTCVLVMHPEETAALENACGVLSSMSVSPGFADDVESAQCLSNVVEAMRSNSSSITLLEFGCMVLRNIILVRNDYVEETSGVIATILQAMRDNPDAVNFQREACSLLWTMAAVSEIAKGKVLSLDGITVLLSCLEHNSSFSDVQDAALGAFNQLSLF